MNNILDRFPYCSTRCSSSSGSRRAASIPVALSSELPSRPATNGTCVGTYDNRSPRASLRRPCVWRGCRCLLPPVIRTRAIGFLHSVKSSQRAARSYNGESTESVHGQKRFGTRGIARVGELAEIPACTPMNRLVRYPTGSAQAAANTSYIQYQSIGRYHCPMALLARLWFDRNSSRHLLDLA